MKDLSNQPLGHINVTAGSSGRGAAAALMSMAHFPRPISLKNVTVTDYVESFAIIFTYDIRP